MLKHALVFCTLLFAVSFANAHKRFYLTIKLDSSINPQKVNYSFYDGKENIVLPDTFGLSRIIVFSERYYSPMASFHLSYNESPENYYLSDFFIYDKPSENSLYRIPNKNHKLSVRYKKNVTHIPSGIS